MKNHKPSFQNLFFVLGLVMLFGTQSCQAPTPTETEETVDVKAIVDQMSLEQKAQLVVGTGMFFPLPDSIISMLPPGFRPQLDSSSAYGQMVYRIRTYLPGTAGTTAEFPEIGITSQTLADGPAGLRIQPIRPGDPNTYYATAFPIATLLASTWDAELIEQVGQAMGEEVLEYGADVILGPGMNLHRDPLCGRNFEYYSEDPLVTGKMAAAMVRGIQSNGVGTSIKHFAVNNQETNRLSVNTILSERALRELYLRGFEIAVKEGKPWTVMSSYNKVNGVYTSEDPQLLTTILRDEWGFDGYVVTDWGGGSNPIAQMQAGNDMIMPGSPAQIDTIMNAVQSGDLNESILDENVKRILSIMVKTPRYKGYEISNQPDLNGHATTARQAAAEGMILLDNRNDALPMSAGAMVAAFGNASYDFISGGTGSGDVNEAYTISLTQGLESAGFRIDTDLQETYKTYIATTQANAERPSNFLAAIMGGKIPVAEMDLDPALARDMASKADIALITIGRNAGEGGDREAVPGDFYLTDVEKALIQRVSDAFQAAGKKTVVVLNIAGVVETASWKDIPDAILCSWQPGQEGGNAVVDVLSGKVNPSGKLTMSFPISYDDTPSSSTFPGYELKGDIDDKEDQSGFSFMQRVPWEVVYEEDIYVGYRYYNTFDEPVSYPFGYGQSYTSFDYGNVTLSTEQFSDELTVSINITNNGSVAGKEVVQVYLSAPEGNMNKPAIELIAFGKTGLLQPGASETLQLTVDAQTIASFDETNSRWVVDPGTYTVQVGASSRDIRETAQFSVASQINAGDVNKVMVPQRDFERLMP